MQLLIVRHAIAEDPTTGQPDALRQLTAKGRERMAHGVQGLRQILPELDCIASSPLLRALQTAELLHEGYPAAARQQWDELAPGFDPERLTERLAQMPADARLALVGHEPDLSGLIAWLATGQARPFMALKKGSACLLECAGPPQAGGAVLLWALVPHQLRRLG